MVFYYLKNLGVYDKVTMLHLRKLEEMGFYYLKNLGVDDKATMSYLEVVTGYTHSTYIIQQ